MTRAELQRLAKMRLDDGSVLLGAKRYAACYYVLGYAVECALKACIAQTFKANTIPDKNFVNSIFTHDLAALLKKAGLGERLKLASESDPKLQSNWTSVQEWKGERRYKTTVTRKEAEDFRTAVADPDHGVLQWLQRHW